MTVTWLLLLISLAVILMGCHLFTNGIEWAGHRLKLGEGAVGSILAAVGTTIPETLIAILALVFGFRTGAGEDVGIGAILGAPLMLSTLAMFVTGVAVMVFARHGRRSKTLHVDEVVLRRDLRYFFIVFLGAAAASFVPSTALRWAVAAGLIGLYGLYVRATFLHNPPQQIREHPGRLVLRRAPGPPPLWLVGTQVALSLTLLVLGAHTFVDALTHTARALGIRPLILSLFITPVATELPEKFNSVLWIRRKKDTLALGNISGAMVFQSSVPPAIGILFTDWHLDAQSLACVGTSLAAAGTLWAGLRWRGRLTVGELLAGGAFYCIYAVWSVVVRP
ncbi:MAG: sodium:calcium antiporter [Chthonomonadales bacterium]